MIDQWYVIGTVRDGDRIVDDGTPLAVLGPWTRAIAQEKCAALRAKWSKRDFEIRAEDEIEVDRGKGRVRTT